MIKAYSDHISCCFIHRLLQLAEMLGAMPTQKTAHYCDLTSVDGNFPMTRGYVCGQQDKRQKRRKKKNSLISFGPHLSIRLRSQRLVFKGNDGNTFF